MTEERLPLAELLEKVGDGGRFDNTLASGIAGPKRFPVCIGRPMPLFLPMARGPGRLPGAGVMRLRI